MENTYWVHDWSPFLVRFGENIGVRWYGLAYVLGFVIALWLLRMYRRRGLSPFGADDRTILLGSIIVGTLVGGRLGFVLLYRPDLLSENPGAVFAVWEGGMASHGGIVGIGLALWWFTRRFNRRQSGQEPKAETPRKVPAAKGKPASATEPSSTEASADAEPSLAVGRLSWWHVADIVVTLGPPGIFLGRVANFINGELWGKIGTVPWAVIFPDAQVAPHFNPNAATVFSEQLGRLVNPRHPSQLYEAALEGLVLGIYLHWRFWRSGITARFGRNGRVGIPGQLSGEFLIAYAVLRIIGEAFREPDADLILGLSRGIFYSLFMILAGAGIIWWARTQRRA
ncbi:MAG: prolipoprotein diacylglyceryl transferase [Opitutales bacterium]